MFKINYFKALEECRKDLQKEMEREAPSKSKISKIQSRVRYYQDKVRNLK